MNGIVSPRQVLAYIGNLGSSLPTAIAQHRGNFFWKRASGAEDELYAGVRDSSGVNQLRRLLTETYADTLYEPIGASGTITVQEGDSTVDAAVTTLDFDSTDFIVTSSPAGEANISFQLRHPFHKTYKAVNVNQGTTTASTYGMPAAVIAATATNEDAADGPWITQTTGGVSGNTSSVQAGTNGGIRADWDPNIMFRIKSSSTLTDKRHWVGLFSSTPAASDDPTLHGIGFRYSTGAGDTNWQVWRNDNSSGGAVTDSGIVFAADTVYEMWLNYDVAAAGWNTLINGTYVGFITSNVPSITTVLTWGIHVTTLTASGKVIKWSRVNIMHE
jgi:hypothetical protein